MERRELRYEGKAKQVYSTSDPDLLIQHFKDDATAFNAQKRGTILDKGILNNRMSEVLFRFLGRILCLISFLAQRIALGFHDRMFRGQDGNSSFSLEQRFILCAVTASKNNSFDGNEFARQGGD